MTTLVTEVSTIVGGYRVMLRGELHVVNKCRRCSCRRAHCDAIAAVTAYLRAGGPRAPALPIVLPPPAVGCPICQAAIWGSLQSKNWHCTLDHTHYFLWRVQQLRQARQRALQAATPYTREVLTTFASAKARADFLSNHALTYPASA